MSVKFNFENKTNYPQATLSPVVVPQNADESSLLSALDQLNQKKQELLSSLRAVEEQEAQVKAQLSQLKTSEAKVIAAPTVVKQAVKVDEVVKPYLLVETTKIVQSGDSKGKWEHYALSLVNEKNEKLSIDNAKKYASITEIVIDHGTKKTVLKTEESTRVERLIHYFATNFEAFRKEINAEKVDFHGTYPNKYTDFECQRFSYYLQHGKEGTYSLNWGKTDKRDYRESAKHYPFGCYSLTAHTADFGKNGQYGSKQLSTHHYMCLTEDVFVSKFGAGDVAFTSYKQILDAYFPPKYFEGDFNAEF